MRKSNLVVLCFVSLMVVVCMNGWAGEVHPSFKGAKKARIIIKEDYGEAKKVSLASDIIRLTSGLLRHAGVEVVTEPVETDFTINVDVKGEALGGIYTGNISGYHYSGAKVKVVVLFKTKDGHKIEEKGGGREEPPSTIYSSYPSPNDAPFWQALKGPLVESIVKLVHKSFGITPLISALKDKNSSVRQAAVEALEKINPKWRETDEAKKAVPEFISSLKDENWEVRQAAAEALEKINPRWPETKEAKEAVPKFISLLKDKDQWVRGAAAEALGEIKDPRAVEPLISALKDKSEDVRRKAAEALEKINPKWRETDEAKKAVPEFISSLKDKDSDVRSVAAEALGRIKDSRAVEPLISLLKDKEWHVSQAAARALNEMIGWFCDDYTAWQRWWQKNKAKYSK